MNVFIEITECISKEQKMFTGQKALNFIGNEKNHESFRFRFVHCYSYYVCNNVHNEQILCMHGISVHSTEFITSEYFISTVMDEP